MVIQSSIQINRYTEEEKVEIFTLIVSMTDNHNWRVESLTDYATRLWNALVDFVACLYMCT